VADRLIAFIGGLTTVPEAAPSAVPAPAKKKTTFSVGVTVHSNTSISISNVTRVLNSYLFASKTGNSNFLSHTL